MLRAARQLRVTHGLHVTHDGVLVAAARGLAAKAKKGSSSTPHPSTATYGKQVAEEDSASQTMHSMGAGRYQYLSDFTASLMKPQRRRLLADKEDAEKPKSAREIAADRNLVGVQRSLVFGTALAFGGCIIGWWITKWYMGVCNIAEFGERMKGKGSWVGEKVKETTPALKKWGVEENDAVADNEKLTEWRRSLRGKFNSEEGAELARKNSIMLREYRAKKREKRNSEHEPAAAAEAAVLAEAAAQAEQAAQIQADAEEDALRRANSAHVVASVIAKTEAEAAKEQEASASPPASAKEQEASASPPA